MLKSSPLAKSSTPPMEDLRFFRAAGDPDLISPGLTPTGVRGDEAPRVDTGDFPGPVLLAGEDSTSWSPDSRETQLDVTDDVRRCGPALVVGLSLFTLGAAGEGLPIVAMNIYIPKKEKDTTWSAL